jgi:prephenate dehydrogenase
VDRISADPAEILIQSNVVILAAPVNGILEWICDLPGKHPGSPIVMDLGSTKADIMRAMGDLPDRFDPLGAHPMCGKEKLSLSNADPGIYKGATFAFCPLPRTSAKARMLAGEMARAVGARPLWLDAETHDEWAAATSHFPYLLSAMLLLSTPLEANPLIGPGFKSTTRLASTPSSMMLDVLETNRAGLMTAFNRFQEQMDRIGVLLADGERSALKDLMDQAAMRNDELTAYTFHGDQT